MKATDTPQLYTLSLHDALPISGSGTVSSDDGGIASCGTSCTASYDSGTPRSEGQRSAPQSQSNGGCRVRRGKEDCTVTMSVARSVTASFAPQRVSLVVAVRKVG